MGLSPIPFFVILLSVDQEDIKDRREKNAAAMRAWRKKNPERSRANAQRHYLANKEKHDARTKAWYAENKEAARIIRKKGNKKWSSTKRKDWLSQTKEHRAEWQRAYYAEHKEQQDASIKRWALNNPEKIRQKQQKWSRLNPEKVREKSRNWAKNNPAKTAAMAAKRRAKKLQATPAWADLSAIAIFYEQADSLNMTVDHIIPLQGKNVCGLHVENNLQLLTKSENSRKRNRFDEHALSAQA